MEVVYEDNHIIIVNKSCSEIVQGDKTGDKPLAETVKDYIKEKYHKPGNVFLGVVHRLDRPVSGLVVFARTSKALSRLNEMFRTKEVHKTYWAIVGKRPPLPQGELVHWLVRNERQNKSYAYEREKPGAKLAILDYRLVGSSDRKGDLKYGSPRSNPDGGICLHARRLRFVHPVSGQEICVEAPLPSFPLWRCFKDLAGD